MTLGTIIVAILVAAQGSGGAPPVPAPPAAAPAAPVAPATPAPAPPRDSGLHARRAASRDLKRYDPLFQRYSKRYFGPAFDWRWFKAQGMAESGLDSAAVSHAGARGVMQLMPTTFAEIQSKQPDLRSINDAEFNIAAGISHDRYLFRLWTGRAPPEERQRFMFASYNAGQGTIQRAVRTARDAGATGDTLRWAHVERIAATVPRWRHGETIIYVRKIYAFHDRLKRAR